ncbi:MAG: T9SS type A sorting domain-containing protein [Paludibacteraceae bacterium]|nr:T9SS type A sorting domain-containing protein [Paludibacteraceae bacterium]
MNYEGNGKCEVYSIEGKLVSVKDIEGKRITISDLASGEYILKIGDKSFKLIKK